MTEIGQDEPQLLLVIRSAGRFPRVFDKDDAEGGGVFP
jgi:hypothetical protein